MSLNIFLHLRIINNLNIYFAGAIKARSEEIGIV